MHHASAAPAPVAAVDPRSLQQGSPAPAGVAASGGTPVGSQSEVLAEAARLIEAETPWYETLGLRCGDAADGGGDLAVETILAFNVVSGLIDAANETVLAPVFVVLKGLLGAVQGAAAARQDIVELVRYCVGISRCLLEAAKVEALPMSIVITLGEFKGEVEAVGKYVQTYGTRSKGCCRRMVLNSHDRDTAAGHKRKLKDLLDAVLAGLAAQTNERVNEIIDMIEARDPPRLGALAEVPPEAPLLPTTFVQRISLLEGVVADITDSERSASATHCLLGMGGGGKTLMASSVVRDDRVRSSFKDGIFWIPVGREGKDVALLLEHLAIQLSRVPTSKPRSCPNKFNSAEEVIRHLSAVRAENDLRCLVALDNVWDVKVVNDFASTGFHVLVTTRQKTVISPVHSGMCTEVRDMSKEDALEVLGKASQANGPLPAEETLQVARDCGMLPLALGMVGTLAKDQPMDPATWRTVHEKLQGQHPMFLQMDNAKLFYAIDTSLRNLPSTQQKQLQLMAVMASGVVATSEMLANLWNEDISDVSTGASVLVSRCLLQDMATGYRLHDLVIEYLQLTIGMDGGLQAKTASSRQARYLTRLGVFKGYAARGEYVSTGGLFSLVVLWNSGSYLSAEIILRTILKGAHEREDELLDVAYTLISLAEVLRYQGRYEEAEAFTLRAAKITENALRPDHPNVAVILGNRAMLLREQGKYDEADLLFLRCIDIQERVLGGDSPELANSLCNRAATLQQQGKFDEAHPLFVRAVEIQERVLGPDHPNLATSLVSLAALLEMQGKLDEANSLLVKAIEILERALGPDHADLALSFLYRGDVLAAQGKYDEADRLYLRCIEIQERALGPDHLALAGTWNNRANLLRKQGNLKEADRLLVRAIEIQERALGADHPHVGAFLDSLAELKSAQGKYQEADPLYLRAINILEQTLGPDHPITAEVLHNRARLLKAQKIHGEARLLFERALAIRKNKLGEGHEDTIQTSKELKLLGEICSQEKQVPESK